MKARFTIANKLILGFGILILATLINGLYTYSTLNENQALNQEILAIYDPSVNKLQELNGLIHSSQMLVKSWVFIEKQSETPDKKKLRDIHEFEFPNIKVELQTISQNWDSIHQEEIDLIFTTISDTLFKHHEIIIENLNSFDNYEDMMIFFEAAQMVEEGGSIIEYTKAITNRIDILEKTMVNKSNEAKKEMAMSFSWFQKFVVFAILILSIFVIIVGFFTTRSIVLPVYKLKEFLISMTKGSLPKEKLVTNNDEIGDMGDALNGYIENIQKTSDFAVALGIGDYNSEFASLGEDDALGNTLSEMRENLKKSDEESKNRTEKDKVQNWITKGLADFGDILRQNSANMDSLAKNIMINVVDYLEVNQGAMYILNENDGDTLFLEMKSAIAYEREKFLQKNFEINEGLVGRCAYEQLPVYLKEIPESYINITSGLGTAEPKYLLLAPLAINEIVMGVIEIASFNEIPEHQIDFLTSLGENIASTILNVRTNEQTKHLLDESKMRSDELSAQEEELRQNMEELQATQEEAARREKEMSNNISAINNAIGTLEVDKNGTITSVNDNLLNKLKVQASALIGKSFQEMFAASSENEYVQIWSGLHLGESGIITTNFLMQETEYWFKHTLTPFRGESGDFSKAIDLVVDITEQKRLENEIESLKTQ